MKTTKPISTVSFNTVDFLTVTLERLQKAGILSFWVFIPHKPETHKDEEHAGKAHCHVYMEPNRSVDTESLRQEFLEMAPDNTTPLGCLPFRRSKWDDWYLYALHNRAYIASKGKLKQYEYESSDFVSSDEEYLHLIVSEIDLKAVSPVAWIRDLVKQGWYFEDIVNTGRIPVMQLNQYRTLYDMVVTGIEREQAQKKADEEQLEKDLKVSFTVRAEDVLLLPVDGVPF